MVVPKIPIVWSTVLRSPANAGGKRVSKFADADVYSGCRLHASNYLLLALASIRWQKLGSRLGTLNPLLVLD